MRKLGCVGMTTLWIVLGSVYAFVAFVLMILVVSEYEYAVEDFGPWALMACAFWLPLLLIVAAAMVAKTTFDRWVGG